jgi:diguanylate cyclase
LDQIKELAKQTLINLKDKKLPATPENYYKEFRELTKLGNIEIEEFTKINKLESKLTQKEKKAKKSNSYLDMIELFSKRVDNEKISNLCSNIEEILVPSIEVSNTERINNFIKKISKNPKNILSNESINELKEITKERVKADREILKKKTDDIIKLTSLMSRYFDRSLLESTDSNDEIFKIREQLEELNISNASHRELTLVQSKLVDTIYNIENTMQKSSSQLSEHKQRFKQLQSTIEHLQKELDLAKEEKTTDFLTGVLNRRGFEEEINKMERKFDIFNSNFAIVFYDIDHFKKINDTYGHACGDAVLRTFGGILKDMTRKEDCVARYGGEEFVALINYIEEDELYRYIKRVKELIGHTDFIYKDIQVDLKFSAGITFRNKYKTYEEAKKMADELLYDAKHKGRNRAVFDTQVEF